MCAGLFLSGHKQGQKYQQIKLFKEKQQDAGEDSEVFVKETSGMY